MPYPEATVGRRILVICPHFPPDDAPISPLIGEIVERLGASGHRIEVVTSFPWYRGRTIEKGRRGRLIQRQDAPWGRITRVYPFPNSSLSLRVRGPASLGFTTLCALAGIGNRRRCDLVMCMSSPFVLGFAGWLVARLRRVPFVFNVQDALADVVSASSAVPGVGSTAHWSRLLQRMERFLYRSADAVTVLSADIAAQVRARIAEGPPGSSRIRLRRRSETQVRVIPNFVDADFIVSLPAENSYRREFGLGDKTVVMYAGNVGLSQPLSLMLDAAEAFADRDDVVFVINGSGSTSDSLAEAAAGADNVVLVGHQPPARLPEVLAAADIHVVPLRRGLSGSSVPSKIYSVMAAARPMVASIDTDSEPARLITDSDCGLVVPPEDPEAFTEALAELVDDPQRRREMGERGRALIETLPSAADAAAAYAALFSELTVQQPEPRR